MKSLVLTIAIISAAYLTSAQKLDSIFFNLYTDSLKKGTFNYINVEGRFDNGRYLPMGAKEVRFKASAGKFDGNSLFIDSNFRDPNVRIEVSALSNPELRDAITIYIKRHEAVERLPTKEEVMGTEPRNPRRKRR